MFLRGKSYSKTIKKIGKIEINTNEVKKMQSQF